VTALNREIKQIESSLQQWFSNKAFVKAAMVMDYPILPEEQVLVANAISRRQQEFATGRWLSRKGLQYFGLPDEPIKMGKLRNPVWPESIIGTISHDGEICAVALMREQKQMEKNIGVDLIHLSQRTDKINNLISMFMANADELSAVTTLNMTVDPAVLLFSIKESVIKAMSFQLDDFIDMRQIEIYRTDKLRFRISGDSINADILAATTDNYLATAIKVRK